MRPQPQAVFGMAEPGMPPQVSAFARKTAVFFRMSWMASTSPARSGRALMIRATAPATWGPAMEVPLKLAKPPLRMQERTLTPGAATSGFIRLLPSTSTGPRLLNPATLSSSRVAAIEKLLSKMAAGVFTDPQPEPLLPADTTTTMPASLRLSTTMSMMAKLDGSQPSTGGHPQELAMTWGAFAGSGFSLLRSVGARNHSKHSM